jgi:hypothetical protein
MVKRERVERRCTVVRLKHPLPAGLEINTFLEASTEEFDAALSRALAEYEARMARLEASDVHSTGQSG